MKITMAVAHHLELNPFLDNFEQYESYNTGRGKIYLFQIGKIPIQLVRTGIGMANARGSLAHVLESKQAPWSGNSPDVLVNFGTAGAIHPDRKIGEVVIGTHSISDEYGEAICDLRSPWSALFVEHLQTLKTHHTSGTIFSTEKAVTSLEDRHTVYERTNAQVVDMECAGLAEVAEEQNLPFLSVKYVSDNADEFAINDFLVNVEEGIRVLTRMIYEFIEFMQTGKDPTYPG